MNDTGIPVKTFAETGSNEAGKACIKVNIGLLDTLMNLAGELVLSRNQLLQSLNQSNIKAAEKSGQRIDLITSELQEAIMQTRMQPIDTILNTFRPIVLERSRRLNKSIEMIIEGNDVELDKIIIESMNDPLSYLVNMAVDHGIELPGTREQMGKRAAGTITLKAFHDAGQVNIMLSDDGSGFDPVKAGGMDQVFGSIEQIGGNIEINFAPDKGTVIQIKLPLTLAIIPSQIASAGNQRFAIPQVNLDELLRIPAGDIKDRIEKAGDADVVRVREELLPLVDLSKILGIEPEPCDRAEKVLNIAIVSSGDYKCGLIVDKFHDSEEIVVKPLGRHLKKCRAFSGATIMGDGSAALILDISNLAQKAGLSALSDSSQPEKKSSPEKEKLAVITYKQSDSEYFASFLSTVERIERVRTSDIELIGEKKVAQYRGGALPLFDLSQATDVKPVPLKDHQEIIVFKVKGREVGLMVSLPLETIEIDPDIDISTLKGPAVTGSVIINGHTTLLVDIYNMARMLMPEWFR